MNNNLNDKIDPTGGSEKVCAPWVSVINHGGSLQGGFSFGVDWGGGCGEMYTHTHVVAFKKVGGGFTNIYMGQWPGLPEHACTFQIPEPQSLYYMIECAAHTECLNTGKGDHASKQIQFDNP